MAKTDLINSERNIRIIEKATNKLALWIIGIMGSTIIGLLGWVVVMLMGINENHIEQKYIDKEQTQGIIVNAENYKNLSEECADKGASLYQYIDKKDDAAIKLFTEYLKKTYCQVQKINSKLGLPVDYNGINANYKFIDTLTVNNK